MILQLPIPLDTVTHYVIRILVVEAIGSRKVLQGTDQEQSWTSLAALIE
jgi:hypothetical protein